MKIAIASDLHLEFKDIVLKNTENAEVLILSGDIMIAEDLHDHPSPDPYSLGAMDKYAHRLQASIRYQDFLKRVSFEFPHVVYVAGNHEFYHGKWNASIQDLRNVCNRFPNIYFLERDTKVINDVMFVGATLWTDCNNGDPLTMHALKDMMNDYRVIRNDQCDYAKLKPVNTVERHIQTKQYIELMVKENPDATIVVVGHHAPTKLSTHPRYQHEMHSLMNGGYTSDLSEFILDFPQIKLWTHGHTHDPFDYMIGDTRVVCNPRGYGGHDPQADLFQLKFLDI
jgi:predicted phosphodiesterase